MDRVKRRTAIVMVGWAVLLTACTSSDDADTTTSTIGDQTPDVTSIDDAPESTTTRPEADLEADIGVDLEADVITLGVAGPVAAQTVAGADAYWALHTVADRFGVVLTEVTSAATAAGEVLAVALDARPLPVEPLDILGMAPTQSIDSTAAGRLLDATRPTLGQMIGAVDLALALDEVAGEPGPFRVMAGPACPFDPMTFQLDGGTDAAVVFVCGEPAFAAETMAALDDGVGTVLLANESWTPDLAVPDDVDVVVLGAVPPASDDAPAADVMAALGGDDAADPGWVRGYTAALTLHTVLEAAAAAGDLTQDGVGAVADTVVVSQLGFGLGEGDVTVSLIDPSTSSGLRVVAVVRP